MRRLYNESFFPEISNLDIFAVGVPEVVLEHVEIIYGFDFERFPVFLHPLAPDRKQAFGEVSADEGMYLKRDVVLVLVEKQILEVVFDFVNVKDGGTDLAFAVAHGAFFLHLYFRGGAHALAGDLDEAEFGGGQDSVFGTIQ